MKRLCEVLLLGTAVLLPQTVVGASSVITISAVVVSNNSCKFKTAPGAINFGTLDPANTGNAVASTTGAIKCNGSSANVTFAFSHDSGLHELSTGSPRMQNTSVPTEYLAYSLNISPSSGTIPKNTDTLVTFTGTVLASDYQNARLGSYSDSVVVSIAP